MCFGLVLIAGLVEKLWCQTEKCDFGRVVEFFLHDIRYHNIGNTSRCEKELYLGIDTEYECGINMLWRGR